MIQIALTLAACPFAVVSAVAAGAARRSFRDSLPERWLETGLAAATATIAVLLFAAGWAV